MPTNAIESGTGDVWQAKQTVLGTIQAPADAGTKHLRKTGDDALKVAKTFGSEEWVDGKQWGSPTPFVDTVGGEVGTLTMQAQIETAGFEFAQIIGSDVVTGTGPDYTHTISSGNTNGFYQSFRQKTGVAVGPWKNSYWDAKLGSLTWNCGQDQKVAHMALGVFALKAGNWYTTDPSAADSGTDAFNWNEVTGAITIAATPFPEIEGETLELDRNLSVHRGDSALAVCFIPGKGTMNRTFNALVTDSLIPQIQTALYGTVTMVDALAPSTTINYIALESLYTRTAVRSLKITTPKVAVDPSDFEIGPRAEGGKIPVSFGGRAYDGGSPMLTVVAKTGDATAY